MWAICGEKTHILPTTGQYFVYKQPTYHQATRSLNIESTSYQQIIHLLPTYQHSLFIFPTSKKKISPKLAQSWEIDEWLGSGMCPRLYPWPKTEDCE